MRGQDFFNLIVRDRQSLRRYLAEIDVPPCLPRAPFYCPLPDIDEEDVCTHKGHITGHRHSVETWLRLLRRAYPGRYHHRTNQDAMLGPCRAPLAEGFPWFLLGEGVRRGSAAETAWRIDQGLAEAKATERAGAELSLREARVKESGRALQVWRVEVYAAREAAGCRLWRNGDWWRAGAPERRQRFLERLGDRGRKSGATGKVKP